jgi:hypothetical protein
MVNEVPNDRLTERNVPPAPASWNRPLIEFARTFDGYKHVWISEHGESVMPPNGTAAIGLLARFTRGTLRRWDDEGALPEGLTLGDLRACLF